MTRIAVSGSHRVGKTTLIRNLPGEIAVVGNVMREIARAGHPVAADGTPAMFAAYVDAQLASERAAVGRRFVVSDRVLADGAAYIQAAVRTGLATYPWTAGELELLRAGARLHAASFDLHVIVPIEFEVELVESFHAGGEGYRKAVQTELDELLERWPVPVLRVTGSVSQRVRQVVDRAGLPAGD